MPQLKNITEAYLDSHRKFCEYRDSCNDMAKLIRANLANHLGVPLNKVQFISLDKDNHKTALHADGVSKMEDGGIVSVGLEFIVNEEGFPSFRQVIPIKIRLKDNRFTIFLCGPDEEKPFSDSTEDLNLFSKEVTDQLLQNINEDFARFMDGGGSRSLGFHAIQAYWEKQPPK